MKIPTKAHIVWRNKCKYILYNQFSGGDMIIWSRDPCVKRIGVFFLEGKANKKNVHKPVSQGKVINRMIFAKKKTIADVFPFAYDFRFIDLRLKFTD